MRQGGYPIQAFYDVFFKAKMKYMILIKRYDGGYLVTHGCEKLL